MKIFSHFLLLLFLFTTALFSQKAHAMIGVHVPHYFDILPVIGSMECRFISNPDYGYLFKRTSELDVTMEVISKGVNEGEKTRMTARIIPDMQNLNFVFLQFFSRTDDYGRYTEFRVNTLVNPFTLQITGDAMFTESSFERDASGKEKETFRPIAKTPIFCKTL